MWQQSVSCKLNCKTENTDKSCCSFGRKVTVCDPPPQAASQGVLQPGQAVHVFNCPLNMRPLPHSAPKQGDGVVTVAAPDYTGRRVLKQSKFAPKEVVGLSSGCCALAGPAHHGHKPRLSVLLQLTVLVLSRSLLSAVDLLVVAFCVLIFAPFRCF